MLEDIPKDIKTGELATPDGGHICIINKDNTEKMSQEDIITFHNVTEKLLYLDKMDRTDLQLGVTLLFTRAKDPDNGDWENLNLVMRYIRSAIGIPLIPGIDHTNTLCWYVDTIFGVHYYMESHTVMMTTVCHTNYVLVLMTGLIILRVNVIVL